jgi:hypothetical protein
MPCDTIRTRGQTIAQRAAEVKDVVARFVKGIVAGVVSVKVSAEGGVVFTGISDKDRDGVTDACVYRRIMATGGALAKAKIAQAEMLAGKSVNRQAIGHGGGGLHSHDGGKTWHHGH